jgi:hypothetical protein
MKTKAEVLIEIQAAQMKVVQGGVIAIDNQIVVVEKLDDFGQVIEISVLDSPTVGAAHGNVRDFQAELKNDN